MNNEDLAREARASLTAFLQGYSWDAFITSTFSRPVRHSRQALEIVSQRIPIGNFGRAFLAAERFYLGGYHVHGLAAFRDSTTGRPAVGALNTAMVNLERLGWARSGGLRNIGGAAGYCAKYLTKQNEIDYDFYGTTGWIALED